MNTIALISVIVGFLSALVVGADLIKRKQSMKIMNAVWLLTALWAGILGLIAYFWFGRGEISMPMSGMGGMSKMGKMSGMSGMSGMSWMGKMASRPQWQSVALSTLHCGGGCTLADVFGEWFLFFVPVLIGGSVLLGSVVVDYLLALLIGVFFQYSAMRGMMMSSKNSKESGINVMKRAFKADVWSLTAWQVGMYGFMAIVFFVLFADESLPRDSWTFWFMMQIAMLCGFATSYPVNAMLIKKGIKGKM